MYHRLRFIEPISCVVYETSVSCKNVHIVQIGRHLEAGLREHHYSLKVTEQVT